MGPDPPLPPAPPAEELDCDADEALAELLAPPPPPCPPAPLLDEELALELDELACDALEDAAVDDETDALLLLAEDAAVVSMAGGLVFAASFPHAANTTAPRATRNGVLG
jgi:hypothetical protein